MQHAVRVGKTGRLTEWCKEQGYDGVTDECIDAALDHPDPGIRNSARFAKNVRHHKR
jgi:hypothetical protein